MPPASPSSSPLNLTLISLYILTFDNSSILLSIILSLFMVIKSDPCRQSIFNCCKLTLNMLCFSSKVSYFAPLSILSKSSLYSVFVISNESLYSGAAANKDIFKKFGS